MCRRRSATLYLKASETRGLCAKYSVKEETLNALGWGRLAESRCRYRQRRKLGE
ncbi:Hypothetical protein DEACI_0867 [Acididesulfobacillus acetoxydans]|uniref:Uncharacterized protein n=1 Tax=Acididesulfobacillus acetoxydans TaxID=1561005 RepID=A0A8S0Y217_9FIRM|nr:Hypothetical protein DEACI_0867 [Acididesulfobacillus acetoxydans]CEJ09593.1 Hypothetical protein DEACI_4078 [Acididesulfobacillus acetoxydans]